MFRATIGMLLIVIASNAAGQTIEPDPPEVIVRTYKFSISAQEFAAARRLVDRILGDAGIRTSWLQCWSPDSTEKIADGCNRPLQTGDVMLKIAPADDSNSLEHRASLGYSYVDVKARTGSVATVYSDRVRDLARSTGVRGSDLLGRAIAHEIGHLLLGTNEHASAGLMRAVWSGVELRRDAATHWVFSKDEAEAIKRRVVD